MRFFKHLSYRTLFTKAVMGISVICLFASDGLTVSATTIKEENIAYNQSLAVQSNAVANWPTGPVISAESAILMDADTGAILYAKNIHQKEYPASTTKILTTLIASERCSMDEIVDFSYDAVHDDYLICQCLHIFFIHVLHLRPPFSRRSAASTSPAPPPP